LNNGLQMPLAAYGVFQIPDAQECERCVADAIRVGYRLIDTAASYLNEEAVGRGIRAGSVPRSAICDDQVVGTGHGLRAHTQPPMSRLIRKAPMRMHLAACLQALC
jgi:diketogulonate reductase-like aldo/keto reductase